MKIGHLCLVLLAPCFLAWNGQGAGQITWSPERHAPGVDLSADAVGVVHEDVIEAVVVLPVPDLSGDGVLTVRASSSLLNAQGVDLPDVGVQVRLREYTDDGATMFRGLRVEAGTFRLEGPVTGPLRFTLDAVLIEGLQSRRITGVFEIAPIDAIRDEYVDEETGEDAVVYHAYTGCWGDWDEEDDPDEVDWEEEDDGGGCGGDDLDDDGPSGSGSCEGEDPGATEESADSGGCSGDESDYESSDTPDDTGCEGDNVDSGDSSGCDCGGDSIDTAAAISCTRGGGPGSPWLKRVVGWLPWIMLFGMLSIMRRHARRGRLVRLVA